jgi:hypothetical protein
MNMGSRVLLGRRLIAGTVAKIESYRRVVRESRTGRCFGEPKGQKQHRQYGQELQEVRRSHWPSLLGP